MIIKSTSGNTGIGLVAAVKAYRASIVTPETISEGRRLSIRVYGAEPVLTDGRLGMKGAIARAAALAAGLPHGFPVGNSQIPPRRDENAGKRNVVLCPDTGDRFLSAGLFV